MSAPTAGCCGEERPALSIRVHAAVARSRASCQAGHAGLGVGRGLGAAEEVALCGAARVDMAAVGTQDSFFGVFDGHGGKRAAQLAASQMLQKITEEMPYKHYRKGEEGKQAIEAKEKMELLRAALSNAALKLDRWIERQEAFNSGDDLSGTTAVTAMVTPDYIVVTNIGDSRAVLCRKAGTGLVTAKALSVDHKPQNADERRRIERAGGFVQHGLSVAPCRAMVE